MSKHKRYVVHIWFVDDDLVASAQSLTDKCLVKSIDGCIGAIVATQMYFVGIRSKKIYNYYFSKEESQQTLSAMFSGWPLRKLPSFSSYSWKESKWCRACRENFSFVISYLEILLDEFSFRREKTHDGYKILKWAVSCEAANSIPYAGIDEIVLPWKAIDPKYRSTDVISGYQKQYCSQIEDGDAFAAYARCKRDIPKFVVDEFHLEDAFER